MKNIIILVMFILLIYTFYKMIDCKQQYTEITESIEYLRKNVVCSKSMILGAEIKNNSIATKNGYLVTKNDTIEIVPYLIFNKFLAFDSLFEPPNVLLFEKIRNKFISVDTIKYRNLNSFKYIPKYTGKTDLYGAMIIKQYDYSIPFTFMLTLLVTDNKLPIKETNYNPDRIKDFKKFQFYIDSLSQNF